MLELFARDQVLDPDRMPITADMIDDIRELLADSVNNGYDIDAVLFRLALSVMRLEMELMERRTDLLSLETRILQAGLKVRPRQ